MTSRVFRLKRAIIGGAVLFALMAGAALGADPNARASFPQGWVVYSGRENGLRVVFELKGQKIVPALVSAPVTCRGGNQRHRLFVEERSRHFAITVNRQGRFHDFVERNDAFEFDFQKLVGQVTAKTINGTFSLTLTQPARIGNEECHTGNSLHGPTEELSFRANRRSTPQRSKE
jgi:hypothetical protein